MKNLKYESELAKGEANMSILCPKPTCSNCRKKIEEGTMIVLKGVAPTNKEWQMIFLNGIKSLEKHFEVLCENCQK